MFGSILNDLPFFLINKDQKPAMLLIKAYYNESLAASVLLTQQKMTVVRVLERVLNNRYIIFTF